MPTVTISSTSPSPSSTQNNGSFEGTAPALTSSASLYLYTFLATLLLLLSVSAAIILRSYVLRRRARDAIAEAIANGTYVAPPSVIAATQPKPVLSDVWIDVGGRGDDRDEKAKMRELGGEWAQIMPVSATLVTSTATHSKPAQPAPTSSPRRPWIQRMHVPMRWYRSFPPASSEPTPLAELAPRATSHAPPSPSAPAGPTSSHPPTGSSTTPGLSGTASADDRRMRLAVFIAMPHAEAPEHGALPSVEFGLAEVPLRGAGELGARET